MKDTLLTVLLISTIMIGQSINQKYTVEKNIIKTENTVGGFNTVEYSVSLNDNNQL